jgi:hypothetical protein
MVKEKINLVVYGLRSASMFMLNFTMCTAALKLWEQGFQPKRKSLEYTSLNAVLKNDFTVFQEKENTVQYSDVKKYFYMK